MRTGHEISSLIKLAEQTSLMKRMFVLYICFFLFFIMQIYSAEQYAKTKLGIPFL